MSNNLQRGAFFVFQSAELRPLSTNLQRRLFFVSQAAELRSVCQSIGRGDAFLLVDKQNLGTILQRRNFLLVNQQNGDVLSTSLQRGSFFC